jgi:heat shock protein HslJ
MQPPGKSLMPVSPDAVLRKVKCQHDWREPRRSKDVEASIAREFSMHFFYPHFRPAAAGFVLLMAAGASLVACSEPPQPASTDTGNDSAPLLPENASSRTGLYVYFADSARFTDCASGESLPVASNAGGLELERAYLGSGREPQQPLLVEIIGSTETLASMEEGRRERHMVVAQLIRVSEESRCPRADTALIGTEWQLIRLGDATSTTGTRRPHLVFDERGAVYGHTGCNSLRGSYQLDGNELSLGGIAATRMACKNDADQESAFLQMLGQAAGYRHDDQQLTLISADGTTLAMFQAIFHD